MALCPAAGSAVAAIAALIASEKVQQRISLPHSGAAPTLPDPRSGTRSRRRGRSPPTMAGARSSVPVSSGFSTTTGSKSTSTSAASQSAAARMPLMASMPAVVSSLAAMAAKRMRTRSRLIARLLQLGGSGVAEGEDREAGEELAGRLRAFIGVVEAELGPLLGNIAKAGRLGRPTRERRNHPGMQGGERLLGGEISGAADDAGDEQLQGVRREVMLSCPPAARGSARPARWRRRRVPPGWRCRPGSCRPHWW